MLRNRLYLGILPLLVILIALGLYAIFLFSALRQNYQRTQIRNYQTLSALQTLEASADKMDTALFFIGVGMQDRGRELFLKSQATFDSSLQTQVNASQDGDSPEEVWTRKLVGQCREYEAKCLKVVRRSPLDTYSPEDTRSQDTALKALNATVAKLIEMRQQRILAADQTFSKQVTWSISLMIVGMAGAVIVSVLISYTVSNRIVRPVELLTGTTQAIAKGDFDQLVNIRSKDEIGRLAEAFNAMILQLRAYRRMVDRKLLHAQQTMRATLDHLPDPVLFFSSEMSVTFANTMAQELLSAIEWREQVPEAVLEVARNTLKTREDLKNTSLQDAVILRINSEERFFALNSVLIEEEEEGIFGAAVVLADVTRLRLADDLKSNLVSTVSHELKTPLTSALMALHLLAGHELGPLNIEQEDLAATALQDVERLLKIIQDILDLSRLESNSTRMHLTLESPGDIVDRVVAELTDQAAKNSISITTNCPADLPEVRADADRIHYALKNLLSNAIKYSPRDTPVVIGATNDGDTIRFSVADKGPGIAEEHLPHLFGKFFRVPGQDIGGTGLGLNIAREIVVAHHGEIGCNSRVGEGSEFFFTIPAATED